MTGGRQAGTPLSRHGRGPDWVVTLIYCEVVMGIAVVNQVSHSLTGAADEHLHFPVMMAALFFILFESIRHAWPMTGLVVGMLGLGAYPLPHAVLGFTRYSLNGALVGALQLLVFTAIGAGLGLVAATVTLLLSRHVHRKLGPSPAPEPLPLPRATSWLLVLVILVAAAPFFESAGLAIQRGLREGVAWFLIDDLGWGWQRRAVFLNIVMCERLLPTALAAVSAFALLKRKRWARNVAASYLAAGLLIALLRMGVFQYSGLIARTYGLAIGEAEYVLCNIAGLRPIVDPRLLFELMLVETGLRGVACAVGIPFLYLSSQLDRFLDRW